MPEPVPAADLDESLTAEPNPAGREDRVRSDVAQAVGALEGVIRIEPTLNGLLRRVPARLRRRQNESADPDPDAVQLKTFGSITDVGLDVAVRSSGQALATAEAVERAIREVLEDHGRDAGRVRVGVLGIEYPEPDVSADSEPR